MRGFWTRFLGSLFVLWAVVTLTFVISFGLPSDPARMMAGAQARAEDVARIRRELRLDRPMVEQYTEYMRRLVHLPSTPVGAPKSAGAPSVDPVAQAKRDHRDCADFSWFHLYLGRSYFLNRSVTALLAERFPRSLGLGLAALFFEVLIAVPLGLYCAARRNSRFDRAVMSGNLLLLCLPTFVTGLFLQFIFAHKLQILPLDGFGTTFFERLRSVVLPALTLGLYGATSFFRLVRHETIAILDQDFLRTARAKGASTRRTFFMHALKPISGILVSSLFLDLGALVGSAVVTESLFRWPGVAAISIASLLDRDGPVLMGCVLVTSISIVVCNALADVASKWVDPRQRS